ncbi:MAG TPA: trimeric intracellular cation channel family protein [Verrucomicrobiota bacterium]|nr:trimeric intracellular cation channel family protein [Verrucomicrobiota bacterium]HNT15532.1 trimeric intracellular cation channel family protein [Verrucomicrobiota bacterium]
MSIPLLQAHFAVAVSAISGVLAASGKRVDLFGVVVLGLVTALGGGTTRDLILDRPVFWLASTDYVINAAGISTLAFFAIRFWNVPQPALVVADAFGLALFTILGAAIALQAEVGATNAVVLGVITGVAGGLLRDVLVGEIPLVMRTGIYLYATASVVGATVYVLLEAYHGGNHLNRAIGIGTTLLLRLLSIRWKVSLPEFPK